MFDEISGGLLELRGAVADGLGGEASASAVGAAVNAELDRSGADLRCVVGRCGVGVRCAGGEGVGWFVAASPRVTPGMLAGLNRS